MYVCRYYLYQQILRPFLAFRCLKTWPTKRTNERTASWTQLFKTASQMHAMSQLQIASQPAIHVLRTTNIVLKFYVRRKKWLHAKKHDQWVYAAIQFPPPVGQTLQRTNERTHSWSVGRSVGRKLIITRACFPLSTRTYVRAYVLRTTLWMHECMHLCVTIPQQLILY